MSVNLSPSEIAALIAENKSLKAENTEMKQDFKTFKSAVVSTLVEFGIVNENLEPQKLNKFKLAKKVGGIILSAMDGETTPFLQTITQTSTPLIEKYKHL